MARARRAVHGGRGGPPRSARTESGAAARDCSPHPTLRSGAAPAQELLTGWATSIKAACSARWAAGAASRATTAVHRSPAA